MDAQTYSLSALFHQLGLDSSRGGIEKLVVSMAPIPSNQALWEAPQWTDTQASMLRQLYENEGHWSYAYEQLEILLRA